MSPFEIGFIELAYIYENGPQTPAPARADPDALPDSDLYEYGKVAMIRTDPSSIPTRLTRLPTSISLDVGSNRFKDGYNPAIPTRGTDVKFLLGHATNGERGVMVCADKGKFIYWWVRKRDYKSIVHHLELGDKGVVGRIGKVGKGYWWREGCNYEGFIEWWLE